MRYRYLFGPVVSGRLGRSLGLDLLGGPICSFNCLYCEAGPTGQLTTLRRPYAPVETILGELRHWLAHAEQMPDHITLGGLGEPCLNSGLGEIISGAKSLAPCIPVAILTNSSLLADPEVGRELAKADVVLPSLDTLVEQEFQDLNHPHGSLKLTDVAQGLLDFASSYRGRIYLEILLVRGKNDSQANLERLREYCRSLHPDRVDVVTMTRPGTSPLVSPVGQETLALWQQELGASVAAPGPVETVRHTGCTPVAKASEAEKRAENAEDALRRSLRRRPQSAHQLALGLGLPETLVEETLETLRKQGHILAIAPDQGRREKETFFALRS